MKAEKHKGKTAYEFEGTNASGSLEALFSDQDERIEAEESLPIAEIPSEAIAAIQAKHLNAPMLRAEKDYVVLDSTGRFSQERAVESARDGEVVELFTRSGDLPDLKLLRFGVDHGEGMYVGDEFVCEVEPG